MTLKLREKKKSKASKKKILCPREGACLSTELTITSEEGAGVIIKAIFIRSLNIVAA